MEDSAAGEVGMESWKLMGWKCRNIIHNILGVLFSYMSWDSCSPLKPIPSNSTSHVTSGNQIHHFWMILPFWMPNKWGISRIFHCHVWLVEGNLCLKWGSGNPRTFSNIWCCLKIWNIMEPHSVRCLITIFPLGNLNNHLGSIAYTPCSDTPNTMICSLNRDVWWLHSSKSFKLNIYIIYNPDVSNHPAYTTIFIAEIPFFVLDKSTITVTSPRKTPPFWSGHAWHSPDTVWLEHSHGTALSSRLRRGEENMVSWNFMDLHRDLNTRNGGLTELIMVISWDSSKNLMLI